MRVSFASAAGSRQRPNEDFVAASLAATVVLDGLSAPAELGTGCVHGTPWYVTQLGTRLVLGASQEPQRALADIIADAIDAVASLHHRTCDLGHPGTPSASVTMLRSYPLSVDYLVLFDSVVIIDGPHGRHVITDRRVDEFARAEEQATRLHPIGTAQHRAAVSALVAAQRQFRNQPNGYWVAGAKAEASEHAITGAFAANQVNFAALLTDGASCLVETYAQSSWDDLLDVLEAHGPQAVIDHVRRVEAGDPDGRRWPRYKACDDATIAYCSLGPPVTPAD